MSALRWTHVIVSKTQGFINRTFVQLYIKATVKCRDIHRISYLNSGTHCERPPVPPPGLEPDWVEDTLIDFNSSIDYHCARGMKFRQDFSLAKQEAICRTGNTWDEPTAWLDCIEST